MMQRYKDKKIQEKKDARQFADSITCQLPVKWAKTYLTFQSEWKNPGKIKHTTYSAPIFTQLKNLPKKSFP